mgnify:FL=1|jgi:hypothetical protein
MTTSTIQSQKLVTPAVDELLEFDFTAISGSAKVHIAGNHEELVYREYTDPIITWVDGVSYTFKRIDFEVSGISCDLTGSVAEPRLRLASDSLWSLSDWASATSGFGLMDYRGLRIRRQRIFYNTTTFIAPQVFYVKTVDELTASTLSFTLTPSLGSERLDRPSARKLEI